MVTRRRTEVFGLGYNTATEANDRVKQLNENPPAGWVPGSFHVKTQRQVHTRKTTYTIIGVRDLDRKPHAAR